jgi:hypothetical protein
MGQTDQHAPFGQVQWVGEVVIEELAGGYHHGTKVDIYDNFSGDA